MQVGNKIVSINFSRQKFKSLHSQNFSHFLPSFFYDKVYLEKRGEINPGTLCQGDCVPLSVCVSECLGVW